MEAFSLLRYWRGGGGAAGGGVTIDGGANVRTTTTGTTIVTAVSQNTAETDEDDDDDGPFFDLEFAVPDDDDDDDGDEQVKNEDDCSNLADNGGEDRDDNDDVESEEENEREFKFTLSSASSGDHNDPNVSLSPSDDLFFKGRLVPIEPSSVVFNASDSSEPNSKSQFPVSLLKSATKFRVLMLKFKKSKSNVAEKTDPNVSVSETPKQEQQKDSPEIQNQNQTQSKFFTVKLKVEEVPIVSLFTRDNSSRNKTQKQNSDDSFSSDERRFSKDVMQRYLKMVKPLYVRVSKRYGEKFRFSGQLSLDSSGPTKAETPPPSTAPQKLPPAKSTTSKAVSETPEVTEAQQAPPPPPSNVKSQKQVNIPAGLRVVCKHLGKSRSASSAVAAAPAPAGPISSKRRDDSLLQQQDGIQSAILHCKRSFNASRDLESSILSRSVSDPSTKSSSSSSSGKAKEKCI